MSLQNRETGEYAPPREQVNLPQQQLQEKTPAEIVTEYVRQDIAVTKKMRESVDKLMMSNELLRQSLGNDWVVDNIPLAHISPSGEGLHLFSLAQEGFTTLQENMALVRSVTYKIPL